MARAMVLDTPDAVVAVTHPVRAAILDALRTPSTAAAVARVVGQSRQNVAYHVRELDKAGLIRCVGERPNGNFIERLYEAIADAFVVSPRSAWGDAAPRVQALADQLSLGALFEEGTRLQADAAALLDAAAFDGAEIPSATVSTAIRFADETDRARFLRAYVDALTELASTYGSPDGEPFRLLLAAYPDPEETT